MAKDCKVNLKINGNQKTPEQLADDMIKEMREAGLSHDDMIRVLKKARQKYLKLKN